MLDDAGWLFGNGYTVLHLAQSPGTPGQLPGAAAWQEVIVLPKPEMHIVDMSKAEVGPQMAPSPGPTATRGTQRLLASDSQGLGPVGQNPWSFNMFQLKA